jgi:predicted phage terminase large subunit-like protein
LAFELTVKSRRVVLSPLYQKLFPEIELRDDLNNKSLWSNTLGGDRYAAGTGGNITGRHAHCIGIDDPIDPKGGWSKAKLIEAAKYVTETLPSRKVDKAVSWTYLVMQRISVMDPTQVMLDKFPNVKIICLPGEKTDFILPPELADYYVDGLFDPVRLSRTSLTNMKAELGEYGYAGQVLQQPIPPGGGGIKTDRFQSDHLAPPPDRAFKKIVRACDKAALAEAVDYTVGVKMGLLDNGQVWILDIRRGQWSTDEREKIIKATAIADGKHVKIALEQEPGSAGIDAAKEAVKRLHGFNVHAEKASGSGSKLTRADSFATQVNMGNVHTALRGKVWDEYVNELTYFPDGINDDQVDASSLAYTILTRQYARLGVL